MEFLHLFMSLFVLSNHGYENFNIQTSLVYNSPVSDSFENNIEQKIYSNRKQEENVDQDAISKDFNKRVYLPILMFHHIENVSPEHPDKVFYGLSYSPKKLEKMLQFFKEKQIETLTFGDLERIWNGTMTMPKKAVMLTFDDGYKNNFQAAYPLLEKYEMKGNFGIITDFIGRSDFYMNEEEIREMAKHHQICSHTQNHPDLTTLSGAMLDQELRDSKEYLENHIETSVNCLIYPSGKYNNAVMEAAENHYAFARTTHAGKVVDFNQRYEFPTVRIFPETGMTAVELWFKEEE